MGKAEKASKNKEVVKQKSKAPETETGSSKEHKKVLAELEALKAKKSAAWKKVGDVVLKEKLKKGEVPKDKAKAKQFKADRAAYDALKAEYEALEKKEKSLRPAKASKTTYDYPESIADDPAAKKRFRARMRTLAEKGITGKEATKLALQADAPDTKKTKAKDEVKKDSKKAEEAPKKSKKDKDGKKKKKKANKGDD